MVEQFATGRMRRLDHWSRSCGFTSGTTRGTSGSMRNADELSMTTQPAAAARGAMTFAFSPPVVRNRRSVPPKSKVARSRTSRASPRKATCRPADAADARGTWRSTGKARCSRMRSISEPTLPVAPPTATWNDIMESPER
jgi:hypothetical protein